MDIVSRLKRFIEYTGLQVSQFADTALIPRPTLSQILNGRNKKISNELITKLHDAFPSLNVLWLMFGDGSMVDDENIEISEPEKHAIDGVPATQISDSSGINTQNRNSDSLFENTLNTHEAETSGFSSDRYHDFYNHDSSSPQAPHGSQFFPRHNSSDPHTSTSPNAMKTGFSQVSSLSPGHSDTGRQPDVSSQQFGRQTQQHIDTPYQRQNQNQNNSEMPHNPAMQPAQFPFCDNGYRQPMPREVQQIVAHEPTKRITHITVFYSDNSYQIYVPSDSIPE